MAGGANLRLRHADGREVTAQEAYDAFMNTRVLIVDNKTSYEATRMEWYDNNSSQNDPSNVGYVELGYVIEVGSTIEITTRSVGDSTLKPQGETT